MDTEQTVSTEQTVNKIAVSFAAIDKDYTDSIVSSEEKEVRGRGFWAWGEENKYPEYLFSLYNEVTTLRTIINGIADYVVGEGVECNSNLFFNVEDLVKDIAIDYGIYGGFALQIKRNLAGDVVSASYIDIKNIRSDKKGEYFWYSEDWSKSYGRVDSVVYRAFKPYEKFYVDEKTGEKKVIGTSILVFKTSHGTIYPKPSYAGDGCIAAETERAINEYHLNSIKNGFSGSYIINMNNGVPEDKIKEEVENNFTEKFTGFQNAGRPVLCWNRGKENETTIQRIETDDFGEKYAALAKNCKQELYSAFRSHPVIFGLPTQDTGFNDQDFKEAFKLFNKTVVLPIQKRICNVFDMISGKPDTLSIKPFAIDWDETETNTEVN